MPYSHLLPVGKIRKPHGIKGEVSADYFADSPALLHGGVHLSLGSAPPVPYEVDSFRFHHGSLLIRFAKIPGRTEAETLRGCEILVPKDRLPEPDDGSVYIHELLGLSVIAVDEKGGETLWGTVEDVFEPAGQEIWAISLPGEQTVLFPAAPDFVLGFDLDGGTVRISPPPGLLELYRG